MDIGIRTRVSSKERRLAFFILERLRKSHIDATSFIKDQEENLCQRSWSTSKILPFFPAFFVESGIFYNEGLTEWFVGVIVSCVSN